MTSSHENLKDAFAGESQANQSYLAFAKKAQDEGRTMIARLFRAAGAAETVHAQNHLQALGAVKDTLANLRRAREGEAAEFKATYPDFLAKAQKSQPCSSPNPILQNCAPVVA